MKTFKDSLGREWQVAVNVDSIKRVKDRCHVNLYSVVEDKCRLLAQLTSDYFLLGAVLHAICKPQMEKAGVSDESFAEGLAGDALWQGQNVLIDEIVDFFPDPRQRKIIKQMIEKMRTAAGMLMTRGEEIVEAINPSDVLKSLKDSSGNSPALSASTLDP